VVFVLTGTKHIENKSFVGVTVPKLLRGKEGHIFDTAYIRRNESVKEIDEILLVRLGAEEALETEVGQQVDV
jgi:hypothetical protein